MTAILQFIVIYLAMGVFILYILGMSGVIDELDSRWNGREDAYFISGLILFWPVIITGGILFVLFKLVCLIRYAHRLVVIPQFFAGMFKFWGKLVTGRA